MRRDIVRFMIAGFLALLLASALTCSAAGSWTTLFDGQTLNGWVVKAKEKDRGQEFWKVRDGAIVCDSLGRSGHDYVWLMTGGEYGDFELELQVRGFPNSPGNSGVQVRSRYDESASWLDGPQVDIHPPAPWRTGLIYDETRGTRRWVLPSLPDSKIERSQAPPSGAKWNEAGWNSLRIVCRGTSMRTFLNGEAVADFDGAGLLDDAAHRKLRAGLTGHIALQLHVRDELLIAYREIRVRPLE